MDLVTLAAVVAAAALAVLAAVLVPTVIQLRKTLYSAEVFIKDLDGSLKPLIEDEIRPMVRSVNGTVSELEGVARAARQGVEKVDDTLGAFREVGDSVRSVNEIINTRVRSSVIDIAAYAVGIRTGFETLVNLFKGRCQKEVQ